MATLVGVALVAASIACGSFSSDSGPTDAGVAGSGEGDGGQVEGSVGETGSAEAAPAADWIPCASRSTKPLFCADFDEPDHAIYANGAPSSAPAMTPSTSFGYRMPAVSPPDAMWIASTGGSYSLVASASAQVTRLDARFELQLQMLDPDPHVTLAVIGMRNSLFDHCYAYLQLDSGRLIVQSHCGSATNPEGGKSDVNRYKDVTSSLPILSRWLHVDLSIDLPTQKVTVAFGGGTPVVLDLAVSPAFGDLTAGGTPYFEVGIAGGRSIANAVIGLDDIEAR